MNDKRINWGPEMTVAEQEVWEESQRFVRDVVGPRIEAEFKAREYDAMRGMLCAIVDRLGGELVFDRDELAEMMTRKYDLKTEYDPNFLAIRIKVTPT